MFLAHQFWISNNALLFVAFRRPVHSQAGITAILYILEVYDLSFFNSNSFANEQIIDPLIIYCLKSVTSNNRIHDTPPSR